MVKNLDNEMDRTWRTKGSVHSDSKSYVPRVCPACNGMGHIKIAPKHSVTCDVCGGVGELEDE